jgi:DNA-binding winged helix-turn-helix (wHTH) protein
MRMANKTYAFSITTNARPATAAQDSPATNTHGTLTTREHHLRSAQPLRACLGEFEVDLRAGELRAGDSIVLLQEQPFQILRMMLEHDVDVVTREEIQETLWADGTIVDFGHSINAAIKKLRRAFGDSADHPHYIETVARRGYRLMVPVRWSQHGQPARPSAEQVRSDYSLPYPVGHLAERRIVKDRRLQVFSGGTPGVAARSPRASRQAFHQPQEKAGQPVPVAVQNRELEGRLLCLERLVLARIRRLRRGQRCLWRLRASACATNKAFRQEMSASVRRTLEPRPNSMN